MRHGHDEPFLIGKMPKDHLVWIGSNAKKRRLQGSKLACLRARSRTAGQNDAVISPRSKAALRRCAFAIHSSLGSEAWSAGLVSQMASMSRCRSDADNSYAAFSAVSNVDMMSLELLSQQLISLGPARCRSCTRGIGRRTWRAGRSGGRRGVGASRRRQCERRPVRSCRVAGPGL